MLRESTPSSAGDPIKGQMDSDPHIKVAIHGSFYRWAATQVQHKLVLDAGCGTGLGATILAHSARKVVGVDRDAHTIERARLTHRDANLVFALMDCQRMAFEANSFEVVVSNALLEYLPDVPAFVAETHRVLRPGGLFICSTKNLELSLKNADGTPRYRDHLQEFDAPGLKHLLETRFCNVQIFSEQMKARSEAYIMNGRALSIEDLLVRLRMKHLFPQGLRRRIRTIITGVELREIDHQDFAIEHGVSANALYIVASGLKADG